MSDVGVGGVGVGWVEEDEDEDDDEGEGEPYYDPVIRISNSNLLEHLARVHPYKSKAGVGGVGVGGVGVGQGGGVGGWGGRMALWH